MPRPRPARRRPNPPPQPRGLRYASTRVGTSSLTRVEVSRGGEALGYLTWYPERGASVHLEVVRVFPGVRRSGIATALLRHWRRWAARRFDFLGCDVVWTGALRMMDGVFGRDRRVSLDNGIRLLTDEEAADYLPGETPEDESGEIHVGRYLTAVYDLRTASERRAEARAEAEKPELEALRHAADAIDAPEDLARYRRTAHAAMPLSRLREYDDVSAWSEIAEGSLAGLSDRALERELRNFRGAEWARRAMTWRGEDGTWRMPPLMVVETKDGSVLGDGRGRYDLAAGLGLKALPVTVLSLRRSRR